MNKIIEQIGECAVLEQLAEECVELAQAALKLARKKRGENPTPKNESECILDLVEEIADIHVCLEVIHDLDWFDEDLVGIFFDYKVKRWNERLEGSAENDKG